VLTAKIRNLSAFNIFSVMIVALVQLTETADWRFITHQTSAEFAVWLRETARNVPYPRGPKKPSSKPPPDLKQTHVSTYQLRKNKVRSL
jgi:hypothetical protein